MLQTLSLCGSAASAASIDSISIQHASLMYDWAHLTGKQWVYEAFSHIWKILNIWPSDDECTVFLQYADDHLTNLSRASSDSEDCFRKYCCYFCWCCCYFCCCRWLCEWRCFSSATTRCLTSDSTVAWRGLTQVLKHSKAYSRAGPQGFQHLHLYRVSSQYLLMRISCIFVII